MATWSYTFAWTSGSIGISPNASMGTELSEAGENVNLTLFTIDVREGGSRGRMTVRVYDSALASFTDAVGLSDAWETAEQAVLIEALNSDGDQLAYAVFAGPGLTGPQAGFNYQYSWIPSNGEDLSNILDATGTTQLRLTLGDEELIEILPVVSLRVMARVNDEGSEIDFAYSYDPPIVLTADNPPISYEYSVTEGFEVLDTNIPPHQSGRLRFRSVPNLVAQDDGELTVTLLPGDGYLVSPTDGSATTTIRDLGSGNPLSMPPIDDIHLVEGEPVVIALPLARGGIGSVTYGLALASIGLTFNAAMLTLSGTPHTTGIDTAVYYAEDVARSRAVRSFNFYTRPSTAKDWRVLIDWDGDGMFDNFRSDVTADVLTISTCKRGRDYSGHVYGRSIAGRFTARLRDDESLYDRFNSGSELEGLVTPGKSVRVMLTDHIGTERVIWEGILDEVKPATTPGGRRVVDLQALGSLSLLTQRNVNVPMRRGIPIGDAAEDILDAANVPAARRGNLTGDSRMAVWWVNDQNALTAIREVEETGLGFLKENQDGTIALEDRESRTSSSRVSVATLSASVLENPNDVPVLQLTARDPVQDIVNIVRVRVRKYEFATDAEVLWDLDGASFSIPAGETWTRTVVVPPTFQSIGVYEWETLAATTDYTANTDGGGSGADQTGAVTVSQSATPEGLTISIENPTVATIWITHLQARGKTLSEGDSVELEFRDDDSISAYGERSYTVPSVFLSESEAEIYGHRLLSLQKEPYQRVTVTFEDEYNVHNIDLSQTVTLRAGGDATQYFVEAVDHRWGIGGRHEVTLTLNPAVGTQVESRTTGSVVLGVGPGLGVGQLG